MKSKLLRVPADKVHLIESYVKEMYATSMAATAKAKKIYDILISQDFEFYQKHVQPHANEGLAYRILVMLFEKVEIKNLQSIINSHSFEAFMETFDEHVAGEEGTPGHDEIVDLIAKVFKL